VEGVLLVCMSLATHFPLDRASGAPLGAQLADRLEGAIRSGELNPGDQLPSVRAMATLAGVNVNTVRTVYGRLEQQGVLSSEHGRGTFVRGENASDQADPSADREYRRELMRQVAELERQAAYYTRHRIVGAPEPPPHRPASQLLPATELISVRDELHDHVQRLRRDEEERLRLISADKAAIEEQELAERAEEIQAAGRRSRGTAANPPSVISGPGAWVLKWRG
jgi:DNA-binding transcriptional regulator YhcF (GntR family)